VAKGEVRGNEAEGNAYGTERLFEERTSGKCVGYWGLGIFESGGRGIIEYGGVRNGGCIRLRG